MGKIKKIFNDAIDKVLLYGGYGMRIADDEIMGHENSDSAIPSQIINTLSKGSLADSMVKGEVNDEVKSLRYRTYLVERESNRWHYNPVSGRMEKTGKINDFDGTISFSQENKIITKSISESINEMTKVYTNGDNDFYDAHTLSFKYECSPSFKIERYAISFKVDLGECGNFIKLIFFDKPDKKIRKNVLFLNSLKKITEDKTNVLKTFLASPNSVEFTTIHASMEYDHIHYVLHDLKPMSIEHLGNEYVLTYSIGRYDRKDPIDKYYDASMDKNYKENKKRPSLINPFAMETI